MLDLPVAKDQLRVARAPGNSATVAWTSLFTGALQAFAVLLRDMLNCRASRARMVSCCGL